MSNSSDNQGWRPAEQLALADRAKAARKVRENQRRMPRQARSRATVKVILKAAAQILERRGIAGFNTNCVAEAAGVSIGSLYQYFPNKQALLDAIVARHLWSTGAVLASLHANPPPTLKDALRAFFAGAAAAHLREPIALAAIIEAGASSSGRAVNDAARNALAALLEHYRSEIVRTDLNRAAFVLVHAVEAVIHGALRERLADLRNGAIADELLAMGIGYLQPAKPATLDRSRKLSKRNGASRRSARDDDKA